MIVLRFDHCASPYVEPLHGNTSHKSFTGDLIEKPGIVLIPSARATLCDDHCNAVGACKGEKEI